MELIFFNGDKSPVLRFINKLSYVERAKIYACLDSAQELGFQTPRVKFRQIRNKLWEIKIKATNSEYRIFYVSLYH